MNRLRSPRLSRFVNRHRAGDACNLLPPMEQNFLQVALTVGLASNSNFNRDFLSVTGKTPSGWWLKDKTA